MGRWSSPVMIDSVSVTERSITNAAFTRRISQVQILLGPLIVN